LAKKLGDMDNILTVSATSYDKDRKKDLRIIYLPDVDLSGKKVLLVDDIAETGDTLKKISEIMAGQYKVGELKCAALGVNKDKCKFYPDFYGLEEQGEWVIFPWEKDDFPEYF
jgi:hypoxanthine phosphoribosyltransferase